MGTEHLVQHNWIRRYEALNTRALDKRTEMIKAEQVVSKCFATALPILKDMHEHLKAKPICDETKEYPSVQEWMEGWAKPFLHLETRQLFHMLGVAKDLVGKVTTEELEGMGIENAKVLREVVRSKGKVSKEMVNKAITLGTKELKGEVRKLLYGKAPDHAEGQWVELVIRGPQEYINDIKQFLGVTRRQEGNGPSDAELMSHVLKPAMIEIVQAEVDRREKIGGVGAHQ